MKSNQMYIYSFNDNTIKFGYRPSQKYHNGYEFVAFKLNNCLEVVAEHYLWEYEQYKVKAIVTWLNTKSIGFTNAVLSGNREYQEVFNLAQYCCRSHLKYRDRGRSNEIVEQFLSDRLTVNEGRNDF